MPKLRIDIWSDIACPWCFVGKRRLEAALAEFPHAKDVEIVWRAFELDPSAPREVPLEPSHTARLAKKYGLSVAEAAKRTAELVATAAMDGLAFDFDRIRSGNTFDAHRVVHLASEHGLQDAVKERYLAGYLEQGEPIGDPETLTRLGAEAGLDAAAIRALLASDAYANDVRADEAEARDLGIRGVPFFVLDGKLAVSGAQPKEVFAMALAEAWKQRTAGLVTIAEGEACGPAGCAVT